MQGRYVSVMRREPIDDCGRFWRAFWELGQEASWRGIGAFEIGERERENREVWGWSREVSFWGELRETFERGKLEMERKKDILRELLMLVWEKLRGGESWAGTVVLFQGGGCDFLEEEEWGSQFPWEGEESCDWDSRGRAFVWRF